MWLCSCTAMYVYVCLCDSQRLDVHTDGYRRGDTSLKFAGLTLYSSETCLHEYLSCGLHGSMTTTTSWCERVKQKDETYEKKNTCVIIQKTSATICF